MYNSLLFAIICFASVVLSSTIYIPCKLSDLASKEKIGNDLRQMLYSGSPEQGIESSDPVFIEEIVGDFPGFKYKLSNNSLVGFSRCIVSNVKIDVNITKTEYDLNCPVLSMSGKYELTGQLLGKPAKGNGDYIFTTGKYFIHIEEDLEKVDVNDGKIHLGIKNFQLKMAPLEPVQFNYTNLFNGQKDLVDTFIKFNDKNWRQTTESIQGPILYPAFKNVFKNINNLLKMIAVEDCIES